jgi:excisionase family DNA binding protein
MGHTTSPINGEGGPDSRLREVGLTTSPAASVREGHNGLEPAIEPLLRARDVADWLAIAPGTVLDWYERGKLPGFKLNGGAVRFSSTEIAAWLAAQHRQAA